MIVAIHQPNYLPSIRFFDKMRSCDVFILLDDAQFTKNGFINRNRIQTGNGPLWLTVPVKNNGRFGQQIRDVEIDNSRDWASKHWKTIKQNYQKAKGFGPHAGPLEAIYSTKWDKLLELNLTLIGYIRSNLGISPRLKFASELAVTGQGTMRLIEICKKVEADTYLSGSGGGNYQDEQAFKDASLNLVYQKPNDPVSNSDSMLTLSALDYLLNEVPV
jgi:hypothetical protein